MNKRQRKKEDRKIMRNDIIYLKLYISDNDRYNPEIKCRGFSQWFRKAMYLGKKYNCNVGFFNQTLHEKFDSFDDEEESDCFD